MSADLVLGAGGLLGRQVLAATRAAVPPPMAWSDPARLAEQVTAWVTGRPAGRYRLFWTAGATTVSSTPEEVAAETATLAACLDALAAHPPGVLVIAGSAGGVHAGNAGVIDEAMPPAPMSPYGEGKVAQEALASDFAARTGTPVAIARLANLYGPGQNPAKAQGLLTALVRANLLRRPLPLYVPLDTRRDYVASSDAAAVLLGLAAAAADRGGVIVKIVATGRPVTIAELIATLDRIRRRRTPVVITRRPESSRQPTDLTFRSGVLPELDRRAWTPLPVGLHRLVAESTRLLESGAY